MKWKQASPGKPGEWNGRPMRWRAYTRALRKANRVAVERIADAEIDMKQQLVRRTARGRLVRNVIVGVALAAAIVVRCAL